MREEETFIHSTPPQSEKLRYWWDVTESWKGLTHHGSRNTVATLNPIRIHITTNRGRLLGAQAMMVTAGMKNWERHKQASQVRGGFQHEEKDSYDSGQEVLTDSPMNSVVFFPALRRTACHRGTATEAEVWGNIRIISAEVQKASFNRVRHRYFVKSCFIH